ncbi:MAG: hypothetical protein GY715_11255, partial [Planctomycetes bacterium]|nr:hypothetical protein [Planctomycetota bacterium]
DGFATHAGGYQAMLREFVPDQCFLDPPCSGVDEGEPCDELAEDTTNGGCNSTPEVFGTIAIDGPPVCGVTWAAGGQQDTDWYAFSVTAVSWVTIEVRGETDVVASLSMMSAGGACPAAWVQTGTPAFSGDCDTAHASGTYTIAPGDYLLIVAPGTLPGGLFEGVFEGFPCPDGTFTNNAYEVELRSIPPPAGGACCLDTGLCFYSDNQAECDVFGGVYHGGGVICAFVVCTGAC